MRRPTTAISSARTRASCELVNAGSRAISSCTRALKGGAGTIAESGGACVCVWGERTILVTSPEGEDDHNKARSAGC